MSPFSFCGWISIFATNLLPGCVFNDPRFLPCLHQQIHSFASGPPPELVAQTRGGNAMANSFRAVCLLSGHVGRRIHSRQSACLFSDEGRQSCLSLMLLFKCTAVIMVPNIHREHQYSTQHDSAQTSWGAQCSSGSWKSTSSIFIFRWALITAYHVLWRTQWFRVT